jgi:hypothetical protein
MRPWFHSTASAPLYPTACPALFIPKAAKRGTWQSSQVDDGAAAPLGSAASVGEGWGTALGMRRTGGLTQQTHGGENGESPNDFQADMSPSPNERGR